LTLEQALRCVVRAHLANGKGVIAHDLLSIMSSYEGPSRAGRLGVAGIAMKPTI
jgi:hypothetical protein